MGSIIALGAWSRFGETNELVLETEEWRQEDRDGTRAGKSQHGVAAKIVGLGSAYAWKTIQQLDDEALAATALRLLLEKGWVHKP